MLVDAFSKWPEVIQVTATKTVLRLFLPGWTFHINPLVLECSTVTCVFLMVLTLLWSSNCGSGGFATASFGNVAYV